MFRKTDKKIIGSKFLIGILLISIFLMGAFIMPDTVSADDHEENLGRIASALASAIRATVEPVAEAVTAFIFAQIILPLVSWFLWLAGGILDAVINFTVIEMRENIEGIAGLNLAWETFRDLANMAFIWILLYIAISTILRLNTGQVKSLLVKLILIALLINFSLFFTKVVVDSSNLLTIKFYDSMTAQLPEKSISAAVTNALGLTTIYHSGDGVDAMMQNSKGFLAIATTGFFSALIMVVAIFVFLSVSLLFVIRYVVFIFLMILSALALAATILPGTRQYFSRWFRALMDQSIFAPAFMALVWVALTVLDGIMKGGVTSKFSDGVGVPDGSGGVGAPPGFIDLVMNFSIVIVLIIAALVLAKTISQSSSSQIGSGIHKIAGRAVGVGMGAAGAAGRQTIGRAGRYVSESEGMKERAAKGGSFSRLALRAGQGAAGASFDARESRLTKAAGGFGVNTGALGKGGGKGGFKKSEEDKLKREEEFVKSLQPSEVEQMRIREETRRRIEKSTKEHDDKKSGTESEIEDLNKEEEALKKEVENIDKDLSSLDKALEKAREDLESGKNIAQMGGGDKKMVEAEKLIKNLEEEKRAKSSGKESKAERLEAIPNERKAKKDQLATLEQEKKKKIEEIEKEGKVKEKGKDRTEQYVDKKLERSGGFFTKRGSFNLRPRQNERVAARLKKGEKSAQEQLLEIAKKAAKESEGTSSEGEEKDS